MSKHNTVSKLDCISLNISNIKALMKQPAQFLLSTNIKDGVLVIHDSASYEYPYVILRQLNLLYDLFNIKNGPKLEAVYFDHGFAVKYPFQTTRDADLVFPQIKHVIVNYLLTTNIDVHKHFPKFETITIHFTEIEDQRFLASGLVQLIKSLTCDTVYVMVVSALQLEYNSSQLIKFIQVVANNPNIKSLVIYNDSWYFNIRPVLDIAFDREFDLYIRNMSIEFSSKKNLTIHEL